MVIRVLIVDDQELMRNALAMVVESQDDLALVGQAADGVEALSMLRGSRADVVVMDVRMPKMDGIEATKQIVAGGDATRVLVLTTFDLDEHAFAAIRAGASGFLLKDAPAEAIADAIRTVHAGDAVIAPSTTRRLMDHVAGQLPGPTSEPTALARLTDREREVLLQVATGASNAEIAQRLYLSETTVKTHVGRLLHKLSLRDRVQAVVFAYEHGLVRRTH